jgi:hypothetical protein
MTATAVRTTPTSTVTAEAQRPSARRVIGASAAAGAVAAAAVYAYGTIAQAVEGKLYAGDPGASHAMRIPPSGFAVAVLMCVALGTVVALGIGRWAGSPARTWIRTSVALTALSAIPSLLASHSDESTRLTLAGGHLLAALVVIPVIARRLDRRS